MQLKADAHSVYAQHGAIYSCFLASRGTVRAALHAAAPSRRCIACLAPVQLACLLKCGITDPAKGCDRLTFQVFKAIDDHRHNQSSMRVPDVPSQYSWPTSRQRWRAMSAGWEVLPAVFAPPARAVPWAVPRAARPSWACPASSTVPSPSPACCRPLPLRLRLLHASPLRRSRLLLLALLVLLAWLGLQSVLLCGSFLSRRGDCGWRRPTALKAAAKQDTVESAARL